MTQLDIRPAGDAAVLVRLGDAIDLAINRRVHALATSLRRALESERDVEIIAGYTSLLIRFNSATRYQEMVQTIRRATEAEVELPVARRFVLPVAYGGELGPDLEAVAGLHHLSPDEVIECHAGRDYPIFCLGFSPGFPFLGGLDPALHTPRLDSPRPRVPAGSVAIGGGQTGVYPTSMPGGWRLIGRTPLRLFDVSAQPPVAYAPGDLIRFRPIEMDEYELLLARSALPTGEVA